MRLACRYALPLAFVSLGSLVAEAHPGHAQEFVPADSAWHYWLQPEHAALTGIVVAMLLVFFSAVYSRCLAARRFRRMTPLPVARHTSHVDR